MEIKLHPLQVKGKYYIDNDVCTFSGACGVEAPEHFAVDRKDYRAYEFKQPATREEDAACRRAMDCCPVGAIRDHGDRILINARLDLARQFCAHMNMQITQNYIGQQDDILFAAVNSLSTDDSLTDSLLTSERFYESRTGFK